MGIQNTALFMTYPTIFYYLEKPRQMYMQQSVDQSVSLAGQYVILNILFLQNRQAQQY
jgi:hypothetical protein